MKINIFYSTRSLKNQVIRTAKKFEIRAKNYPTYSLFSFTVFDVADS